MILSSFLMNLSSLCYSLTQKGNNDWFKCSILALNLLILAEKQINSDNISQDLSPRLTEMLQKVEKRTQIDRVKVDVFSIDFKPRLGVYLNLVNWNTPILAYRTTSNYLMVWQKKRKQNLLNSDFKKVFLVNGHDYTFWVVTTKNIIRNMQWNPNYLKK